MAEGNMRELEKLVGINKGQQHSPKSTGEGQRWRYLYSRARAASELSRQLVPSRQPLPFQYHILQRNVLWEAVPGRAALQCGVCARTHVHVCVWAGELLTDSIA